MSLQSRNPGIYARPTDPVTSPRAGRQRPLEADPWEVAPCAANGRRDATTRPGVDPCAPRCSPIAPCAAFSGSSPCSPCRSPGPRSLSSRPANCCTARRQTAAARLRSRRRPRRRPPSGPGPVRERRGRRSRGARARARPWSLGAARGGKRVLTPGRKGDERHDRVRARWLRGAHVLRRGVEGVRDLPRPGRLQGRRSRGALQSRHSPGGRRVPRGRAAALQQRAHRLRVQERRVGIVALRAAEQVCARCEERRGRLPNRRARRPTSSTAAPRWDHGGADQAPAL